MFKPRFLKTDVPSLQGEGANMGLVAMMH